MADQPYVGEITIFAGNYAPLGWQFCSGQLVQISEYDTLFNLIGTTYGGDGQSTFALPDLCGRVPIHQGNGYVIGQSAGTESETLIANQIPQHNHLLTVSAANGTSDAPLGNVYARGTGVNNFAAAASPLTMNAATLQNAGGGQPHNNMHPYLAVNYIISMFGIFPTPN